MKNRHYQLMTGVFVMFALCVTAGALAFATQQQDQKSGETKKQAPHNAQEAPPMPPAPGEHHKWLEQLIGTWNVESEMIGPDMPPMKATGTDTVRTIGGRWVVCELKSEMPGMGSMSAVLSLGYDSETGKYQGTWIDSVHDHLWVYVGTLDSTKKVLTLEAEGPNMMDPSKGKAKYRDVIEIKDADHRTLKSFANVDGEWVQFVTATYTKKK